MGNFELGYTSNIVSVLWDFTPCIFNFHPPRRRWINTGANIIFPLSAGIGAGIAWILVKRGKRKGLMLSAVIIQL
ncbi:unnamed protein product [Moneuplotes crassus]|uniref:Uncharacterized protein n=1 Tax=Euplotes crassus TaxID=5936 RepID=A0AAD1UDT6_EUPCR|nr:unnamed protein product [Moneuplotes crassus]